jgi:hypothetical protein
MDVTDRVQAWESSSSVIISEIFVSLTWADIGGD